MRHKKTILVIGGSGFLGSRIAMRLRDNFKVFATFRMNPVQLPGVSCIPFEISDRNWVKRVLYQTEPEVIIYAAGKENVGWCELYPRDAERLHTAGAASLSTMSTILQPKFIYLSDSYVFDGKKGNYKEDDIVLPLTSLGKTKIGGENYIRGKSLNYIVVRTSPVFGRGIGVNKSWLDRLRMKLSRGEKVELSTQEIHSFAPISGFLDLMARLADSGPKNKILHYGGLTKITTYEFGVEFAKRFGFSPDLVAPAKPQGVRHEVVPTYDYSLNSSNVIHTLKTNAFLLEEAFDLLEKEFVTPD